MKDGKKPAQDINGPIANASYLTRGYVTVPTPANIYGLNMTLQNVSVSLSCNTACGYRLVLAPLLDLPVLKLDTMHDGLLTRL